MIFLSANTMDYRRNCDRLLAHWQTTILKRYYVLPEKVLARAARPLMVTLPGS